MEVSDGIRPKLYATACLALLLLVCQFVITSSAPLAAYCAQATRTERLRHVVAKLHNKYRQPLRIFLGATGHPVFMDSHFRGYNHIIGIAYKDRAGEHHWLPIIDESGKIGFYNSGRLWVKWSWRVNSPNVNMELLERGIRDYTAFWARQNHINLINVDFTVFVKRIDSPELFASEKDQSAGWEPGFYRKQMAKPWQIAGQVHWDHEVFEASIQNIEEF